MTPSPEHLSDDQFIDRLYGIEGGPESHLESCAECLERWEAIQQRRAEVVTRVPVSPAALGEQRRQVLERLEPPRWRSRRVWAPALAAALLIAAGLAWYRPTEPPAPAPEPAAAEAADPSWYEDAYFTQPVEPRAASPLRALFEEETAAE
jgi:hypothetical protein